VFPAKFAHAVIYVHKGIFGRRPREVNKKGIARFLKHFKKYFEATLVFDLTDLFQTVAIIMLFFAFALYVALFRNFTHKIF
jgi:hypothetical protein